MHGIGGKARCIDLMTLEIQSALLKSNLVPKLNLDIMFKREKRFDELWKKVPALELEGLVATSSPKEAFDKDEFFQKIS